MRAPRDGPGWGRRVRAALLRAAATALLAVPAVLLPGPARAQGGERILAYDVTIRIEPGGALTITEVIDYDFGLSERHGIFRDVPVRLRYDDTFDRIYPLEVLSVRASAGTPAGFVVEDVDGSRRIRIGDPHRTVTGRHVYEIRYRVDRALNSFPQHDELFWNAIGPEWPVPIGRATAEVVAPAEVREVLCFQGPPGSTLPCDRTAVHGSRAVFGHDGLGPGQGLTVVVALPKGAVPEPAPLLEERWSPRRAFAVTPAAAGLFVLVLAATAAALGVLLWRVGRDRRAVGSAVDIAFPEEGAPEQAVPLFERGDSVVEYRPPDGLRPGQVGTLVDETANPLDVSATIVDLAVRGYLRIEEVPKTWLFGRPDWRLVLLRAATPPDGERPGGLPGPGAGDRLLEFERVLLDGLFESPEEADPQGRPAVLVSSLRRRFAPRLQRVQEALYRDAVHGGWFAGPPNRVRAAWRAAGIAVAAAGAGLVYAAARWTHLGLVPVPVLLGGLALATGARWMPRRTARGTALVRRLAGFRRYMATAEAEPSRFAERANLFYELLPYAVVFGLTDRWARAFQGLAEVPPASWYVGSHPFSVGSFSHSIQGFTVSTAGTIAATPSGSGASGFGSGRSSGGGGGGGGGGSW